jgi:HTH-type transcriptional regulator/antitoxin HipB
MTDCSRNIFLATNITAMTASAETMDNLHSVVLFHRKKSGLTQAELARVAGVGKTVVFDIEKGKRSIRMSTLLPVLDALNIRLSLTSPLMGTYERLQGERDAKS